MKKKKLTALLGSITAVAALNLASAAHATDATPVIVPAAGMAQTMQGMANAMSAAMGSAIKNAAIRIESGKRQGSISVASMERILKENPGQVLVIDVREALAAQKSTLAGAINIPLDELEKKLGTLSKDKPVVFACDKSERLDQALGTAKSVAKDLKAYFLDADVDCDESVCKLRER